MEKESERKTPLAKSAWDCVKPVCNASIDDAARRLQELAEAVKEWDCARKLLEKAIRDTDAEAMARALEIASERLRNEADRRKDEAEKYSEALYEKCREVSRIHPDLCGNMSALMSYASGAVGISEHLEYFDRGAMQSFTPEITEANAGMMAAFAPVRRFAPDNAAIRPDCEAVKSISCLVSARRQYDTASRVLSDALAKCEQSTCALSAEADIEATSVKEALTRIGATDAPNGNQKPRKEA